MTPEQQRDKELREEGLHPDQLKRLAEDAKPKALKEIDELGKILGIFK